MSTINIDLKAIEPWISKNDLDTFFPSALGALEQLHNKSGKGNDFLGWVNLPDNAAEQAEDINKKTSLFKAGLDCIVVIGIGGSYLGTKAVLEALNNPFGNNLPGPEICYAGHHLSEDYLDDLIIGAGGDRTNVLDLGCGTSEELIYFRQLGCGVTGLDFSEEMIKLSEFKHP